MLRHLFFVCGFSYLSTTFCFSQGRNVRDTLVVIDTLVVYDTLTISKNTILNDTKVVDNASLGSTNGGSNNDSNPNRFKNMYNTSTLKSRWNYSTRK